MSPEPASAGAQGTPQLIWWCGHWTDVSPPPPHTHTHLCVIKHYISHPESKNIRLFCNGWTQHDSCFPVLRDLTGRERASGRMRWDNMMEAQRTESTDYTAVSCASQYTADWCCLASSCVVWNCAEMLYFVLSDMLCWFWSILVWKCWFHHVHEQDGREKTVSHLIDSFYSFIRMA